jgi:hypothetical protein
MRNFRIADLFVNHSCDAEAPQSIKVARRAPSKTFFRKLLAELALKHAVRLFLGKGNFMGIHDFTFGDARTVFRNS